MKEHKKYDTIILVILMLTILIATFTIALNIINAKADAQTVKCWVICQPGDYVNAREAPSTRSEVVGRLDGGDPIWITGKTKNGFAQIDASFEVSTAWVYSGYIVFDEPKYLGGEQYTIRSNGRVAARKRINGDRRAWLVDGSTVKVYWWSAEWCVTDKGFVKTEFIGK